MITPRVRAIVPWRLCAPSVTAVAAALLLLVPACGGGPASQANAVEAPDLHVVQRSDLRITVREQAEVQAAQQTSVRSMLEGRDNTLIYLIPEGSVVQEGERLAELDVSEIQEKRANQGIAVAKAEAVLEQARKSYEIMEKELEASKNTAESAVIIAGMELEKFLGKKVENPPEQGVPAVEGTNREMLVKLEEMLATAGPDGGPADVKYASLPDAVRDLLGDESDLDRDMGQMANQILEQIDQIRLAQADLVLKGDTLHHSEILQSKDFITKNELEKDKLTYDSQLSKVTLAWNDIDLLVNYTLRQEKIRLEQDLLNAELELQSVMAGNDARRVRERADLESNELEYNLAKERLENWDRQIQNAVITAPTPGLVVYAKQGRGGNQSPVEEGMQVHRRQTLIVLPDVTNMVAELKVHEADIDKVAPTQRATIEVDAYPERLFTGTVTRVSALPDSASRFANNDLKVYKTTVTFDGENEERVLKPGMNATVEIMIGVVPDCIIVPSPAVHRQEAVHYVWKQVAGRPLAVPVEVGRNNLTHVEVLTGLVEGDVIYLTEPAGAQAPEFAQPEIGTSEAVLGDAESAQVDARMRRMERERAAAMLANPAELYDRLRRFLLDKLPNYAEVLADEDEWYRLLSDEAFVDEMEQALQADPDLRDQWRAFRSGQGQRPPAGRPGGPRGARGRGAPGRGRPRGGDGR